MRRLGPLLAACGLFLGFAGAAEADSRLAGVLSFVSANAIEIDGVRILLTPGSVVMSGPRAVSRSSLRRGQWAEAEVDEAGRLLHLRVNRVVE